MERDRAIPVGAAQLGPILGAASAPGGGDCGSGRERGSTSVERQQASPGTRRARRSGTWPTGQRANTPARETSPLRAESKLLGVRHRQCGGDKLHVDRAGAAGHARALASDACSSSPARARPHVAPRPTTLTPFGRARATSEAFRPRMSTVMRTRETRCSSTERSIRRQAKRVTTRRQAAYPALIYAFSIDSIEVARPMISSSESSIRTLVVHEPLLAKRRKADARCAEPSARRRLADASEMVPAQADPQASAKRLGRRAADA